MSKPAISVILCTHNPRESYLRRTLVGLAAQSMPREQWELVVVDNCSMPAMERRLDLSWHPVARIVIEENLGLTPARLRGIEESQGDLLVLVDDDNILDADYLEVASRVAAERSYLGSWSGQCMAEFDEPPPSWTRRYWGALCIREFDTDVWSNLPRLAATMPAGAGMCVRKNVAEYYRNMIRNGQRSIQLDRTGDSLISGGDNDLAACACDLGLGMGLISAMKLKHLIPPQRLQPAYLARLIEGISFSSTLLDVERGLTVVPRGQLDLMIDALRVLRQGTLHGRILRASYRGRNNAARLIAAAHNTAS